MRRKEATEEVGHQGERGGSSVCVRCVCGNVKHLHISASNSNKLDTLILVVTGSGFSGKTERRSGGRMLQ